MNYIDPTIITTQLLYLNCNCDADASIAWTLTQEGDDDIAHAFTSPSANFVLSDQGYYQQLSCNFDSEGIDLLPERSYLLKGISNGRTVYVGKVFVTDQDIDNYSVHDNKYTLKTSTNNFTILD